MAFTYDQTLVTPHSQLRFLIRDANPAQPQLDDAQVQFLLDAEDGNVWLAAVAGINLAMLTGRRISSFSADGISVSYLSTSEVSALIDYYQERGWWYRMGRMNHQWPTAGGISLTDIEVLRRNEDWPRLPIRPGQFDNPAVAQDVGAARDPLIEPL